MRLLILFLFLSLSLPAESIHWWGSYDQALHAANTSDRRMLVVVVEPRCPACKALIRDLSRNPMIVRRLNRQSINVIVTHDRWRHYPNELYFTTQFPTLFWVDPRDERMVRPPMYGYTDHTLTSIQKVLGL